MSLHTERALALTARTLPAEGRVAEIDQGIEVVAGRAFVGTTVAEIAQLLRGQLPQPVRLVADVHQQPVGQRLRRRGPGRSAPCEFAFALAQVALHLKCAAVILPLHVLSH